MERNYSLEQRTKFDDISYAHTHNIANKLPLYADAAQPECDDATCSAERTRASRTR